MLNKKTFRAAIGLTVLFSLAACGQGKTLNPTRETGDTSPTYGEKKRETIFGSGGLDLFNSNKKKNAEDGNGIGVNAYLWQATLQTINFLPLASADSFGGVIITDWYAPPESPTDRFKLTVIIQDRALRADAIHITVFRQVQNTAGEWVDAAVDPKTAIDLENAVLTRARELRTASQAAK